MTPQFSLNENERQELIDQLAAQFQEANTELHYRSPFELLVAVILSAQTTDRKVNCVTQKLFSVADTPKKLAALDPEALEGYLKPLGLQKIKTRYLLALSHYLQERYDGQLPSEQSEFLKLPGVGRKTANILLGTLHQQPVIAVDTHVFRVCNRTGLAKGKTVQMVEKQLMSQPECRAQAPTLHHWLVLHGRYVCLARKPACHRCCLQSLCLFYRYEGDVAYVKSVSSATTGFAS